MSLESAAEMQARALRDEAELNREFEKFLQHRGMQLLISMIPPSQPPELLRTVLWMAYRDGAACATGQMSRRLAEIMAASQKSRGQAD